MNIDLTEPPSTNFENLGWLDRIIEERAEARRAKMALKHEGDARSAANEYVSEVFHKLPLLFFLSMPFFALFLKLLYFNSPRKRYVEHFIFSVYHYAFLFMVTGLFVIIQSAFIKTGMSGAGAVGTIINFVFILYLMLYLWFSLRRFYHDRWYFRLLRYLTLAALVFLTMLILFLIIMFVTFLL